MAEVNLWEIIGVVANSSELSRSDYCKAIKEMRGPRFGTELTLEIADDGVWRVNVFDHNDTSQFVEMAINPNGFVTVTRGRSSGDIHDKRTISF